MKVHGFVYVAAFFGLLHLAGFSLVLGTVRLPYLLSALVSGVLVWIILRIFLPLRGRVYWTCAALSAVAIQLVSFRILGGGFESAWWPAVQFFSLHGLVILTHSFFRSRRRSTFVWQGSMLKK